MILITGCGRSGTHYTSALLKAMGLDVPHEAVGKDGAASWKHIVSGTFVYIGKNRSVEIDSNGFGRILHQVRHPLKVIASMQTFSDSTWSYMAQHIDLDLRAPILVRAMQAWIGWNALVESRAQWRFQIERLHDFFDEFCAQAGLSAQAMPQVQPEARDSRTHRFKPVDYKALTLMDPVLTEEIRLLGAKYGYEDPASSVAIQSKSSYSKGLLAHIFRI